MPVATEATSPPPPRYAPNKDDDEDLRAITAALDRMRKVTPPDPYVLTIPQDVEPRYHHHHHPAWAEQWLRGTPFQQGGKDPDHENLQYQTFIHHEHGRSMYVLHNSRPLESSTSNGAGANRARSGTGASTPSNSGPKKKISLDAYKKKLTGASATSTPDKSAAKATTDAASKQGAVKGPVERVKAETEEMLAAVAESEAERPSVKTGQQALSQQKDLKRKREEDVLLKKSEPEKTFGVKPLSTAASGEREPIAKKPKTEGIPVKVEKVAGSRPIGEAQQISKKSSERQRPDEGSVPLGMPPRLSPGMPEKLSPLHVEDDAKPQKRADKQDTVMALPRRLSDTIPGNILKTLEGRTHARSGSDLSAPNSASKAKDGKLTPLARPNGITKKKSPIPRNGFRASSSPTVRSDAEDRIIPKFATVQRAMSPELSQDEEIIVGKALAESKAGRKALLVKFKFKKNVRESVQRILKMRPQSKLVDEVKKVPEKPKEQRNGEKSVPAPSKGVATKVKPSKEKRAPLQDEEKQQVTTKRLLPDEEKADTPTKRSKTEEQRKEPSTPAPKEIDSPMAQKSTLPATPGARKDFLSAAAMQRQQSQDSTTNYNTPPAQASTPSLGNSANQANGLTRPPSSQPSSKTPKQQSWETDQKRFEDLGRELKHAAQADFNATGKDPKTQMLVAVKVTESLLCYLLAFTCADEAALAADPKQAPISRPWLSLVLYWPFVRGHVQQFGPLNGLVCFLRMVFSAHILHITSVHKSSDTRESIIEIQGHMFRAAIDAESKLDLDKLQEQFPTTWSRRTKKLSPVEKLELGKLGGAYKLPLDITTSPVRAARAGHAMLLEWIEKEHVNYTLKLKL